jgi:hypothetical protein
MRESPESLMLPAENTEIYSNIVLALCENCKWSCSNLKSGNNIESCPMCKADIVSNIPMTSEEVCRIEIDVERGMVLQFSRRTLVQ